MNWFDFSEHPIRSTFLSVFVFYVFILVFNVLGAVFAPVNTATEVVKQALDPQAVVYNYEWFKQQYQDVKAFSGKIKNTKEAINLFETSLKDLPVKDWSFEQNQRRNELNAQVLGLKNQCEDMVRTYNARAKMANRNFVKFEDVPEELTSKSCEGEIENAF